MRKRVKNDPELCRMVEDLFAKRGIDGLSDLVHGLSARQGEMTGISQEAFRKQTRDLGKVLEIDTDQR